MSLNILLTPGLEELSIPLEDTFRNQQEIVISTSLEDFRSKVENITGPGTLVLVYPGQSMRSGDDYSFLKSLPKNIQTIIYEKRGLLLGVVNLENVQIIEDFFSPKSLLDTVKEN